MAYNSLLVQEPTLQSFPPFCLDGTNQCLWRDGVRIALAPKVFSVLEYLVRHAGRLVPQQELLEAVWPETYVQPEVLRRYILEIRKALVDPAKKPRFIETSPKRGYRFVAQVRRETRVASAVPAAAPSQEKLVGRATLIAELTGYLRECSRGQRQLIFVTGEPGIGKTSLVDAFAQHEIGDPGVRVTRGQCVEGFAWKEAYYPVLEAVGELMRGPDRDEVIRVLAAQAPTWLVQFASVIKAEETERLRRELLGATRERMMRELCDALETLSLDRPLLLILEDLQWVDNPTLDLISAVARRRGPAKLMLLATYRPVEVILSRSPLKLLKQDLLVHRLCREISLARLTEADVEQYLLAEFPQSSVAQRLCGPLHRHSDGNPLFMRAILERVLKTGVVRKEGHQWTLTRPPEDLGLEVPETLQQILETQVEQLGTAEQQLLRAASVVGRRFSAWAAGALLDTNSEQVEKICEALIANQQFIRPALPAKIVNGAPLGEYEFKHLLYREVLYRQLPPTQRRHLHLRLGKEMEALSTAAEPALASELAYHFEEGQDSGKALHYLMLSATSAIRRYAHGESIQLLNRALDLIPQVPAENARALELDILERISDSLYAQGEMQQSAEIDYRAAELSAQRGLKVAQVHALTRVARALAFLDPARCITVCDKAAEVSRGVDEPLLQVRAELLACCWHIVANGWNPAYAARCGAARDRLRQLSQELAAYYEILYAHVQCIEGAYLEAYRTAQAGISKAVETDSLVVYLSAHSSLVHALLHLGRWGELLQALAAGRDVASKNKNAPWVEIFQAHLAWLHFHACDFEGALRLADDILADEINEPSGQVRTMATITAAFAQIELGSAEKAIPTLDAIYERPEHPRFFMDWYWRKLGRLALSRAWLMIGDRERAGCEAELFLQSSLGSADPNLKALAWEMKARVAMDKPDVAWDCLDQAFAALPTAEVPSVAWRIHAGAARACALHGDRSRAEHHREQAMALLRKLADSFAEGAPLRSSLISASQGHPLLRLAATGD